LNNSAEIESIFIHNIIIINPFNGSPLTCIKNVCGYILGLVVNCNFLIIMQSLLFVFVAIKRSSTNSLLYYFKVKLTLINNNNHNHNLLVIQCRLYVIEICLFLFFCLLVQRVQPILIEWCNCLFLLLLFLVCHHLPLFFPNVLLRCLCSISILCVCLVHNFTTLSIIPAYKVDDEILSMMI